MYFFRFLHHTLAYKGPTLVMLKTKEESVFCVACPDEWHESHQYWGREESALYQLLPKFGLMETGPKMLYLNFTARGYPHGLRVGSNPRSPIISIDGGFEKVQTILIKIEGPDFNLDYPRVFYCRKLIS